MRGEVMSPITPSPPHLVILSSFHLVIFAIGWAAPGASERANDRLLHPPHWIDQALGLSHRRPVEGVGDLKRWLLRCLGY